MKPHFLKTKTSKQALACVVVREQVVRSEGSRTLGALKEVEKLSALLFSFLVLFSSCIIGAIFEQKGIFSANLFSDLEILMYIACFLFIG